MTLHSQQPGAAANDARPPVGLEANLDRHSKPQSNPPDYDSDVQHPRALRCDCYPVRADLQGVPGLAGTQSQPDHSTP